MDQAASGNDPHDRDLRPENHAAARALVDAHPHLAAGLDREAALRHHARNHRELGDDMFRLAYRLRPPRNRIEETRLDFLDGKLTPEEHDAIVKAYLERPADEAMFEAYYGKLRARVLALSRLVIQAIDRVGGSQDPAVSEWAKGESDGHLAEARVPLSDSRPEIDTADRFAAEARLDGRLPPPVAGECRGASVRALVAHAAEMAFVMLRPGADGRIPEAGLPRLYDG